MKKLVSFFQKPWWRNIVNFGAAISSLVINFVVIGILGNGMPDVYFWVMAGTVIILVSTIFFALWAIVSRYTERTQYSDRRQWDNKKKCEILDRNCCGDLVCRTLSKEYEIKPMKKVVDELEKKSSLFLQQHILSLEKNFYASGGKEILIVSSSLESEVSVDGIRGASELVRENLMSSVEYHYFCARNTEPERVERNIRNIKKQYENCGKFDFNYYDAHSDLSEYLLYLFGIVIYVYKDDSYEAYFSIRRPDVEPVYRKMPICMAGRYVAMFKKIRAGNTPETIKLSYNTYQDITSDLYELRHAVFVEEQKSDNNEEFIGDESSFLHCCIYRGKELIAGVRVGKYSENPQYALISRIVVKADYRGRGIGRKIVRFAETKAIEQGYKKFVLLVPTTVVEVFKKTGYVAEGDEFMKSGIPHIKMTKSL